jgi:hypothetical protein
MSDKDRDEVFNAERPDLTPAEMKCLVKVVMSDVGKEAAFGHQALSAPHSERPFPGGLYQHFKGHFYRVLHIARDSDTLEDVVVYKEELGRLIWTRKLSDWMSLKDDKTIRFRRFNEFSDSSR